METAKVLSVNHSKAWVEGLLIDFQEQYKRLKTEVPKMPTLGGSVMVNLAAMSVAFYHGLKVRVSNEEEVTRIFYDIAWNIYAKMGRLTWKLAGLTVHDNYKRLLNATNLFRSFPFNSPSYQWKDVAGEKETVAFDCLRCPVAEYFKSKDLSGFCAATWCALDYPLAKMWNSELEREGSIAGGATVCDFRWRLKKT